MTSIDPRTYQAIDEALDDAGQTTRVTVVEAIVGHSKLVESYRHVHQSEAQAAIAALGKALGR